MTDAVLRRLYAVTFLYTLAQAIAIPLVPEFLSIEFGASLRFIGVVMGVYGLMQIVLRLPMGDMADRKGRKPSILLAFGCTIAAGVFLVAAPSALWTIPGVAFFGLAGGIFWVAANAYLFDRVPRDALATATTDYSIAVGGAFLVGPPLGHVLADTLGFRAAFLAFVASSILGTLLLLTLPETPPEPRPRSSESPYRRAARLLRHPAIAASAAGTLLYSMLFSVMTSFFQLHVLALGFSVTLAGFLLGGRQASALLVRFRLPLALQRFGAVRVLLAGLVVSSIATGLVPFATGLPTLVAVVAIAGAATGVMIPANLMLVHEGAPPHERGLANGIYGTMLGVGSTIAPALFGAAGERFGLDWTFWTTGATTLVLALVVVAVARARQ